MYLPNIPIIFFHDIRLKADFGGRKLEWITDGDQSRCGILLKNCDPNHGASNDLLGENVPAWPNRPWLTFKGKMFHTQQPFKCLD